MQALRRRYGGECVFGMRRVGSHATSKLICLQTLTSATLAQCMVHLTVSTNCQVLHNTFHVSNSAPLSPPKSKKETNKKRCWDILLCKADFTEVFRTEGVYIMRTHTHIPQNWILDISLLQISLSTKWVPAPKKFYRSPLLVFHHLQIPSYFLNRAVWQC